MYKLKYFLLSSKTNCALIESLTKQKSELLIFSKEIYYKYIKTGRNYIFSLF